MSSEKKANALLLEILIVILFFMLGAIILMRVYQKAYLEGDRSKAQTQALSEAQSVADRLYSAVNTGTEEADLEGFEKELLDMGFMPCEGAGQAGEPSDGQTFFMREGEGYRLVVGVQPDVFSFSYGTMSFQRAFIQAYYQEEKMFELPVTHYAGFTAEEDNGGV